MSRVRRNDSVASQGFRKLAASVLKQAHRFAAQQATEIRARLDRRIDDDVFEAPRRAAPMLLNPPDSPSLPSFEVPDFDPAAAAELSAALETEDAGAFAGGSFEVPDYDPAAAAEFDTGAVGELAGGSVEVPEYDPAAAAELAAAFEAEGASAGSSLEVPEYDPAAAAELGIKANEG